MPKKKSTKKAADNFDAEADKVATFAAAASAAFAKPPIDEFEAWSYDYAIIRLYRAFENLMLDSLVAAINNDTSTIAATTAIKFPKHLPEKVCLFLIVQDGFFDFRGRDGLIKTLKQFVPPTHFLVTCVEKTAYKGHLEKLSALRNFAAHDSAVSKERSRKAVGTNHSSAGSWLMRQGRLLAIIDGLKHLSADLRAAAPY